MEQARPSARVERCSIGVDIGGTFTDCAIIDQDGRIVSGKAPTTPADRSIGFFDAIADCGRKLSLTVPELMARCNRLVHGTTTGTNAIVTRSGATVGLLTTVGHRDVMFIMKGSGRTAGVPADQLMDLIASRDKPVPIVPKHLIVEVPERVDVNGEVIVEIDRDVARACVTDLVGRGVESIAISLLWSIKNPAHEHLLADVVKEVAPDLFVTCASDLVGRMGEYERTAATVMNAYIGPLMNRYVDSIEVKAREYGYDGRVLFSQCAGGAITGDEAKRSPILTVNSGPVAGVMNSVLFAQESGEPNVLTTDMGGTTYDVSLIRDYGAMVRDTAILEKYELALPVVDVESIGAGGGSIAWIDASGRLNVGPRSAGAVPGPACYGKGGTEPTVTDADVVLGVIDPGTFLHGSFTIDPDAAAAAISKLGGQLGLGLHETAAGINRIIDAKMADVLRRMSEFRGLDPRQFVMLAFGGGGPVHAAASAREAGVQRVVVPLPDIAPVWSAAGGANADIVHVYVESRVVTLPCTAEMIDTMFAPLLDRAALTLASDGFGVQDQVLQRSLKMKYSEQVFAIDVAVDFAVRTSGDVDRIVAEFIALYEERYGKNAGFGEGGIQITGFHVRGTGVTPKAPLLRRDVAGAGQIDEVTRQVYWAEFGGFAPTPVLRSSGHWGGQDLHRQGPLLVELPDTVVVVRPGQSASLLASGSIVIDTSSAYVAT